MSTRQLTTTSYAILGLLAIREWSAYELTGYMRTSAVRAFWPRTESRLYEEPKNLIAHGLARASTERTGRRRRTVYRITAKGRRVFRRWLDERAAPRQIEDEAMLKIFFADQGTPDQLRATVRRTMEDLHQQMLGILEFAPKVARGEGQFPERSHINALSAHHMVGMMQARLEFLIWAHAWVRDWSHTKMDRKKQRLATEVGEQAVRELETMERKLGKLLRGEAGR